MVSRAIAIGFVSRVDPEKRFLAPGMRPGSGDTWLTKTPLHAGMRHGRVASRARNF
jgi:hypothetical protein